MSHIYLDFGLPESPRQQIIAALQRMVGVSERGGSVGVSVRGGSVGVSVRGGSDGVIGTLEQFKIPSPTKFVLQVHENLSGGFKLTHVALG